MMRGCLIDSAHPLAGSWHGIFFGLMVLPAGDDELCQEDDTFCAIKASVALELAAAGGKWLGARR